MMKRYIYLTVVLLICMLFMPLFAANDLFAAQSDPPPDSSSSSSESSQNSISSEQTVNEGDEDVFILLDESDASLLTVSEYDYLCGVVAAEMLPSFHSEALKAQAVAAYTVAYRKREQQRADPDDALQGAYFTVNTAQREGYVTREQAQAHWGDSFEEAWARVEQAVTEVSGQLLVYEGEPILAVFHAISSGTTETASVYWSNDLPYLQAVESPGDTLASNYQTQVSFSADDLKSTFQTAFPDLSFPEDITQWFTEATVSDSGTVTSIKVGDQTLSGRQVRETLGLRSACFTVSCTDTVFTFTVQGYGHGVGMSQYGADYMARQGSTWQEILLHYYQGATIVNLSEA